MIGKPEELPEFIEILPGHLKVLKQTLVDLECEVKGEPSPEVKWYRDGAEILEESGRTSIYNRGSLCRLLIREVEEIDSGRYMCEATNKAGRASTFCRLSVVSDPKVLEADENLKRWV